MDKTKKKQKKIAFNLADYAYMDEMPLRGWVWEFKRRSKEYRKFWQEKGHFLRYQILPWANHNPKLKFCEIYGTIWDPRRQGVSKSYPVESVNLKWHSQQKPDTYTGKYLQKLPDRIDLETRKVIPATKTDLLSYAETFVTDAGRQTTLSYSRQDEGQDIFHPLARLRKNLGKENLVMVLVDLSAPIATKQMTATITKEIAYWRRRLKLPKSRAAKTYKKNKNNLVGNSQIWKSYLMIYDLIELNDLTYKAASDYLSQLDVFCVDHYGAERKVQQHYEAAKFLINGGFKALL